ncbi:MAG: TetR/AcrR family transcriptional regulator [Desulfobacterales bacterium]|jgi:AcrR family transcriptional regulator
METASRLFAEKGYASTTVREIVSRAGVSKPVLYYYFQSKEGLYYAILGWATEVQTKIIDDVFNTSGAVQERIIYLYRRIYEGIQEHQGLYAMIHGLIYGPPQGAPKYDFPNFHRQMFEAVKRICFEGLLSGEIKKADIDEVSYLVLGLIDFSLNLEKIQPELTDPQRPERLLRMAFQGLSRGKKD